MVYAKLSGRFGARDRHRSKLSLYKLYACFGNRGAAGLDDAALRSQPPKRIPAPGDWSALESRGVGGVRATIGRAASATAFEK